MNEIQFLFLVGCLIGLLSGYLIGYRLGAVNEKKTLLDILSKDNETEYNVLTCEVENNRTQKKGDE